MINNKEENILNKNSISKILSLFFCSEFSVNADSQLVSEHLRAFRS